MKSILRQDIGWHDKRTSNDFASRITEYEISYVIDNQLVTLFNKILRDLNKVQDGIGEKLGMFIFLLTNFIVSIANAFYHGWSIIIYSYFKSFKNILQILSQGS